MALSPIQAQWSIDTTSAAFLSAVRGILAAATSDNVQALAMVACQQFGATLAICDETLNKIQSTVVPSPQPALIKFLGATVGYYANDCATQLGESQEGLRFLSLAAPIITTLSLHKSAKVIHTLLRHSASATENLFPTLRHLRDLLASLEARSCRCGFTDSVVGWQTTLRQKALPHISRRNAEPGWMDRFLQQAPSPEIVDKLVDTFRQLGRIGDHSITGATIKAGAAVPWIVAFTKWCLGLPPSIYMDDHTEVLRQSSSRITIIVPTNTNEMRREFEITIHKSLSSLSQLVSSVSTVPLIGVASVEKYGEWLLPSLRYNTLYSSRALEIVLQYGIPQVLEMFNHTGVDFLRKPNTPWVRDRVGSLTSDYGLCALPDLRCIEEAYSNLLRPKRPPQFEILASDMLVSDNPQVASELESLSQNCRCSECNTSAPPHSGPAITCEKHYFFLHASFVISDILAVSLFDSPTPLLVRLSTHREPGNQLQQSIARLLKTGNRDSWTCGYMDVFTWARNMIGHEVDPADEDGDTLVTSGKGQVAYPALLDSLTIEKHGYLKLLCYPGTLKFEGEAHNVVMAGETPVEPEEADLLALDDSLGTGASMPLNLYPSLRCSWNISTEEDGEIRAMLTVRSKTDQMSGVNINPMHLFFKLEDALMLERCPHHHLAKMNRPDRFCSLIGFLHEHEDACKGLSHVDIVPVDRAEDLRCFAVACTVQNRLVLRKEACLDCCLKLCREADIDTLIL
ncbi:hypothetical protein SPI_00769 [Niveomyces insectorum RCEF 264]|uniref:Uncharacterized protein n=1 Tax=Niveomyces insectorum RCEF 264 TaxID=1081102 RepID=A0A162LCC1_9HYPO|nr:hypothetical protein SPI_00769 [Niveomyces insectorum RCEF 264]